MTSNVVPPHRQTLQQLAHQAGYPSRMALAQGAGVSDWQLARLERGLVSQMSVGVMVKLAIALGMPLDQLLTALGSTETLPPQPSDPDNSPDIQAQLHALEREYQRLQSQLAAQSEALNAQFQHQVLDTLEPWLLQWPTAAAHAQQNPAFSAQKLLPLTRPIAALLTQWQIEAIAAVGDLVPYDPRWHEFMGDGLPPAESTLVVVRYVGYRQADRLLYRAKVSLPLDTP
ncbi:MAG: helix-turn-helix transcriptional regulator [Synechocystis sp.]|nr:helix-turn-helix transcriptional regulator [Synechocystis sp.]